MSLKAIHVFVIFLSILLLFFFGFWALSNFRNLQNDAYLYLGILSAAVGTLLVPYLIWFIMKTWRRTAL